MGTRLDQVATVVSNAVEAWNMSMVDYNIIRYGMEELLAGRQFLTKNQIVAEWCLNQADLLVKSVENGNNCFWKISLNRGGDENGED